MSVTRAEADALAIIAELVSADQSVAWLEDALCSRMGQALVADEYSPDQLFEVLVENITQSGVEDLAEQFGRSRLLMAAARIAPHPGVETLVEAVERLRRSAVGFPEDSIVPEPTSGALWSRDVYSLRFAIVAPFFASVGASDRWYLWDIDLCSGSPFTVGGGYFPTAEEAFAEWRAAVGPEAAGRSQLEPVTDADLAASFFPRASDNYYARESASQYAEYFRSRRLGQELSASSQLGVRVHTRTHAELQAECAAVADAWAAEFAAWRAQKRDCHDADATDYRELSQVWISLKYPELSYNCSPHGMAMTAVSVRLLFDADYALALCRLFPDLAAWLSERALLPSVSADRLQGCAARIACADTDVDDLYLDPMARIRE
ncbi:hypothetical protein ABIA31_003602 [Catenulispora sp. MAP5-51]|uniref:hypothetical protein n=1 Tax=Catenulispora sp. MAP5-51 TaxID=3156298 RepID=UPI00351848C0